MRDIVGQSGNPFQTQNKLCRSKGILWSLSQSSNATNDKQVVDFKSSDAFDSLARTCINLSSSAFTIHFLAAGSIPSKIISSESNLTDSFTFSTPLTRLRCLTIAFSTKSLCFEIVFEVVVQGASTLETMAHAIVVLSQSALSTVLSTLSTVLAEKGTDEKIKRIKDLRDINQ